MKVEEALVRLKAFLDSRNMPFIVVGSLALKVHGMPLKREPEDIDIEVMCTPEKEVIFRALADAAGNDFYKMKEMYPQDEGIEHKPYIFPFEGVVVNVWVVREFTHSTFVYKDYIRYAGVYSILRKKMRYKRLKDYQDLTYLISKLSEL